MYSLLPGGADIGCAANPDHGPISPTSSKDPVQGVRLAGWLVAEPWITPSVSSRPQAVTMMLSLEARHSL
jgi:hypothetical protein